MSEADCIYTGGPIVTMEPSMPRAEAIAVAGGRIIAVGSAAEVERTRGPSTRSIDLKGATLMPGFVEAHSHPLMSAMAWGDPVVDVRAVHTPTYAAVLEKIKRRVKKATPGEAIWFLGLDPQLHAGMGKNRPARFWTRSLLTMLSLSRPVISIRVYTNTKALETFRIDASYKPPLGGRVVRTADDRPWKFVETSAWMLLKQFQNSLGADRTARCFERLGREVRPRRLYHDI